MDHAQKRGIECAIAASLTEFPPEFAPLLKGAQKIHQLGELTIMPGPGTPVDYMDAGEAVHRAAAAEAAKKSAEASKYAEPDLAKARRALETYAWVARDQADRGTTAVMNEYVYRPLKAKVAGLYQ